MWCSYIVWSRPPGELALGRASIASQCQLPFVSGLGPLDSNWKVICGCLLLDLEVLRRGCAISKGQLPLVLILERSIEHAEASHCLCRVYGSLRDFRKITGRLLMLKSCWKRFELGGNLKELPMEAASVSQVNGEPAQLWCQPAIAWLGGLVPIKEQRQLSLERCALSTLP